MIIRLLTQFKINLLNCVRMLVIKKVDYMIDLLKLLDDITVFINEKEHFDFNINMKTLYEIGEYISPISYSSIVIGKMIFRNE